MKDKLFAQLFPVPYEHGKWLKDQAILIERMKATGDEYIKEQAGILEECQKDNQCSSLILEIIVDRIERHTEKKDLTTPKEAVSINI